MGLFDKKTDAIRKAMKKSYKKHVDLCIEGKLPNVGSDTPHNCGLYGALYSRNVVCGLRYDEPTILSELSPFFFMPEMDAIEALADYAVYRELPYQIEAYNLEELKLSLNNAIDNTLGNEKNRNGIVYAFLQNFHWNNLIFDKNRHILIRYGNELDNYFQNQLASAGEYKGVENEEDYFDEYGSTALHDAVADGDIDEAKELIEDGLSINMKNSKDGRTPLFYALEVGQEDMVKFLLNNGADVNIKDNEGYYPIQSAIINKDFDLCDLLLEKWTHITFDDLDKTNNLNVSLLTSIYLNKANWVDSFI